MLPAVQLGLIVENIGVGEVVVIALLALVVLGPDRLPEMARGAGRLLHNAKKFTSGLSGDMQDVINDPAMQPIRELGEFATRPRQKLAEYALEAEAEERQRQAEAARPVESGEDTVEDPVPGAGPATDSTPDESRTDESGTHEPGSDEPRSDEPRSDETATAHDDGEDPDRSATASS